MMMSWAKEGVAQDLLLMPSMTASSMVMCIYLSSVETVEKKGGCN